MDVPADGVAMAGGSGFGGGGPVPEVDGLGAGVAEVGLVSGFTFGFSGTAGLSGFVFSAALAAGGGGVG